MPIFDTHSHYNLEPIFADWQNLAHRAQKVGVKKSAVVGTNIAGSLVAANLREKMPDFFLATIGIHPEEIANAAAELASFAQCNLEKFAAYGEIGLDFYRLDRQAANFSQIVTEQKQLLQAQLQLALKNPKPIILHIRDDFVDLNSQTNAYGSILKIIAQTQVAQLPLVFHCFSGDETYLRQVLSLPHSYISFAGNLTFKNASNLQKLASLVPAERLLLETDAPFLSPAPKRGQFCQPEFIVHTANFAAANLSFSLAQIYRNSCRLFNV